MTDPQLYTNNQVGKRSPTLEKRMDFSKLLVEKIDLIAERWVEAVQHDQNIVTAHHFTFLAVRDSLPKILQAMATVLSQSEESDLQLLVETSLEHGNVRAEQGFEPSEIAREYRLLRWVIFNILEPYLLESVSALEMLRAVRLIDTVIDEAIARCFQSYTEMRLRDLDDLQNQMQLTNQELKRLVRASQENMAHLAHELKTPLTSIIGYSDTFLRQQRQQVNLKDSPPNLNHIEQVLKSGRQLLHLINDALEISRYETGQMQLHLSAVNVCSLIHSVVDIVQPMARDKNLQIAVDCQLQTAKSNKSKRHYAPKEVTTDALRLQQILTNLISNAVRYTDAGKVKVSCYQVSDQEWAIAVQDTGRGISTEDQSHVFEPYFQVDGAASIKEMMNSTGLGLAIVSRLVKLLQGRIEMESRVGKGTTFTLILPLNIRQSEEVATKS